jgi:hypothetical protein
VHGFVVSQEPVAGSEVPAESQVFLYIGAPARTVRAEAPPVEESAQAEPWDGSTVELDGDPDGELAAEGPVAESPVDEADVEYVEESPVDEDPADAEFVDDEAEDEWFEEREPTRVWRVRVAYRFQRANGRFPFRLRVRRGQVGFPYGDGESRWVEVDT